MSTENNVADGEKKGIRYFLDTCALMNHCRELDEPIAISSITLQELNNIKENKNKTDQVRFKAREAARWIKSRIDDVKVVNFDPKHLSRFNALSLQDTPDNRIILCADEYTFYNSACIFWTEDTLCLIIAKRIFKIPCKEIESSSSGKYTGWIDRQLTDQEIAAIYENPKENSLGLLTNQYAVIKGSAAKEAVKWDGSSYVRVKIPAIKSKLYGAVKPYQGDVYQQMALDSLSTNQVTMLKGHAGTGKSYLALGYLFYLLEKGKIDKIIVFANPVAVGDACQLGYYPGTKDEKLLDSQVGNMLVAKVGDRVGVERMIDDGQLELLAMADIRGFDTTKYGPVAVYITEAQNFSINLMKLALQRIGEETIVVIDGDYTTQVDRSEYAGSNNGMARMSEVFRGKKPYGEVELKNIYRSQIARIADEM